MMQKKNVVKIGGAISFLVILGLIFILNRAQLMDFVQKVAVRLRTQPYSSLLLMLVIIITSIPPMLGFTFTVTIAGFIYGFPGGVLPAVSGAFIGSMVAFGLIRKYNFARFIKMSPSKQEKYVAIQEAIEEGGFKMMLLIRLSPIPWPITNMLLSILPTITTKQFILAAMISSCKVTLEVWIGSQLADLSNPNLPPSAHRIAMMTMGCGVLILLLVAWWLYTLTMQKVKQIAGRKLGEKHHGINSKKEEDSIITLSTVTIDSFSGTSPLKKQM